MNQKFTVDQYELCLSFKNENIMTASAEFLPTGEHFLSETIELMRIKKDTVLATLQRKSEKNLRCEFEQVVDHEDKYLMIKFIVSFDFLPEFSETIKLQYVEKKESLKNLQVSNFKADIEMMEGMLDAYQKNGVWRHNENLSVSGNSGNPRELKNLDVTRGRYLLRVSGVYTTSTSQMGSRDKLNFMLTVPGKIDKINIPLFMHSASGYSYPFSFEEVVDCSEGELKIEVQC